MQVSKPVFFLIMAAAFMAAFFLRERKKKLYYKDTVLVKGKILEKNRRMGNMNKTTVSVAYQFGKRRYERHFSYNTASALALGEEVELLLPKGKPGSAYPKTWIVWYRVHSVLVLAVGILFLAMALFVFVNGEV
ncbi:MAG: hypothetical protein J6D00_06100 [Christensenellaceae bacterium]|nr:hypothetical protein [Christensenellaceae bacterium]